MAEKMIRIWVDPGFKKMLKKRAAEEERSVVDLTRDLCDGDIFEQPRRRKKDAFGFHW